MTVTMVICVLIVSAAVGMLLGQTGGGGSGRSEPVPPTRIQMSTPVATPVDLPPFFVPVMMLNNSVTATPLMP